MKKPIVCPHCGTAINLENDVYADIVSQVRTEEFKEEVNRRIEDEKRHNEEAIKLAESNTRLEMQNLLAKKDDEILALHKRNESITNKAVVAVRQHEEEVNAIKISTSAEISSLKEQIKMAEERQKLAIASALTEEQQRSKDKDVEIEKLKAKIVSLDAAHTAKEAATEEKYREQLRAKEEEVEFYKDLKTKMSTKMVGESLEQHCEIQFNQIRATAFKNAYFEKDNDARTGSKGDYIFREEDEYGNEIVSIMFEMKNENDTTATKHKNEDFFKELDKDRKEKNCEYAVLVSMLESDSDLYNAGIVDVSYKYDKMYVVRPQCFIPIITLLRNAALNALMYKQELADIRNQDIDISNFEDSLLKFKNDFTRNYELAHSHFDKAIEEIDRTILHLEKVKKELQGSDNQLRIATNKVEDVSVKKLTKDNPTMREKFEKCKKSKNKMGHIEGEEYEESVS